MSLVSRSRVPLSQRSNRYLEALEELWRQKGLPLDARNVIVGAAHRAALRDGDKLLTDEEVKTILDPETTDLHPDQWLEIYERTHRWLFVKKKCRPQHVQIILRTLLRHLNTNHGMMAMQFQAKLAEFN